MVFPGLLFLAIWVSIELENSPNIKHFDNAG